MKKYEHNTDYVAGIDDSGGNEALVRWNGDPIPGQHPITLTTAFFIRTRLLDSFNREWCDLQDDIQRELGCGGRPPIHMRIMWGKTLPPKYRGDSNPYLDASFEQIQGWVKAALGIVRDFCARPKDANWQSHLRLRADMAKSQTSYLTDPRYQDELRFLRSSSRGELKKMYSIYHNRITSPLLPPLVTLITCLNEYMRIGGKKTMKLFVDPFPDSHGIDTKAVLEAMASIALLEYISEVQRIDDSDLHPVCQAADLIGFIQFRLLMHEHGHIDPDAPLFSLWEEASHRASPFSIKNAVELYANRVEDWSSRYLATHYAIARQAIHDRYPDFVDEHLVTVEEFLDRAREAHAEGSTGVRVLADDALELS